jgi:carbonic anhydrase
MAREIIEKIKISIYTHGSVGLAVVGHYDCAGHPGEYDLQAKHIKQSIAFIHSHFPDLDAVGLWVNEKWEVEEIPGLKGNPPK